MYFGKEELFSGPNMGLPIGSGHKDECSGQVVTGVGGEVKVQPLVTSGAGGRLGRGQRLQHHRRPVKEHAHLCTDKGQHIKLEVKTVHNKIIYIYIYIYIYIANCCFHTEHNSKILG